MLAGSHLASCLHCQDFCRHSRACPEKHQHCRNTKKQKKQKLLGPNPCTFMVCRQGQSEATRSVRGQGQWPLLGAPDSSGHFFSALLCPCFSTLDVQEEKLFYPCPESGEVNTPQWCALPAGKEKQFPFSTSQ